MSCVDDEKVSAFLAGVLSNFDRPALAAATVDCTVTVPTPYEMAQYVFGPQPTVLKGLLTHFALRHWSLDYFKALDARCPTSPAISVARNNVEQATSRVQRVPFRSFIAEVEALSGIEDPDADAEPPPPHTEVPRLIDPRRYIYCNEDQDLLRLHFPPLLQDLEALRAIFPASGRTDYSLWIGPRGSVTGLHADHDYNSLIQCQGKKTVIFVSMDQEPCLYRSGKFDPGAVLSRVDLRKPQHNATSFPRVRDVIPTVVHLEAGDVVCIPWDCYHFVVCTEGPSISCTISLNSRAMKAKEDLERLGHRLGLYGWTQEGCTCHNA